MLGFASLPNLQTFDSRAIHQWWHRERALRTTATRSPYRGDFPTGADSSEVPVEPDVDPLMDRVYVERRIGNWLRALDRHLTGACRADERMKPLRELDISSGVAEDRPMAKLGQVGKVFPMELWVKLYLKWAFRLLQLTLGKAAHKMGFLSSKGEIGGDKIGLAARENRSYSKDFLQRPPYSVGYDRIEDTYWDRLTRVPGQ